MSDLSETWANTIAPRDRRPIYKWAEDNITIPASLAIGVGRKFDSTISPHFNPIFDALQDRRVRVVVLRKPVRGGGTLISDIWHCWTRANDPGPAMAIMQGDQMAGDHSEARLMPMMLNVPAIREMLPVDRHKIRNKQILFSDGIPFYVTGPAIGKMQSKGIRAMSIDEMWLPEVSAIEADARGRLGDYEKLGTSKLFIVSQAGVPGDAFDNNFEQGTQEWLEVCCTNCNHMMVAKWQNKRPDGSRWGLVWDKVKTPNGTWIPDKAAETVRFECEKCQHQHEDAHTVRTAWKKLASYRAMNPKPDQSVRSFHIPGYVDYAWNWLLIRYLNAINSYKLRTASPLVMFFQKFGPEPKNESTIIDMDSMVRALYDVDESGEFQWKEEECRFMTIDKQKLCYWTLICAWSKTGEVRRLHFSQEFSYEDCDAVRDKFKVEPQKTFIDLGYMSKNKPNSTMSKGALAACQKFGWRGLNGVDSDGGAPKLFQHTVKVIKNNRRVDSKVTRPYSETQWGDPNQGLKRDGRKKGDVPVWHYSGTIMKDIAQGLVESGMWVEDMNATGPRDEEFRKQFNAEIKVMVVDSKTGKTVYRWKDVSNGNNHGRDLAAMQCVPAMILKILPNPLELEKKD